MGYYINPKTGTTKQEWLRRYGDEMPIEDIWREMAESPTLGIPVCLVDNGFFDAAAIGFSKKELQEFATDDGRSKQFFIVNIDAVKQGVADGIIPDFPNEWC